MHVGFSCESLTRSSVVSGAVDGIGAVIAASIVGWFADPDNLELLERLRDAGLQFGAPEADRPTGERTLTGRTVVVSGTLEGFTRTEAVAAVKARGGTSPSTVSKSTFALVVGDAPGASKVTKAERYGVPIVEGVDFVNLLETGNLPTPTPTPAPPG